MTCHRLHAQLSDNEFILAAVAEYQKQSCSLSSLSSLARQLASAMYFARAIGLAADARTLSAHGRQLVLAASDDVEQVAKLCELEGVLDGALEHARTTLTL